MPRNSKRKASDSLRQTTLLDTPSSRRLTPGRQNLTIGRNPASSSPSKVVSETSSDDLAAINFAPTKKKSPISISSADDGSPSQLKVPFKRKSKHVLPESPSESQPGPSSQILASRDSNSDSEESEPPQKKRRLRRRKSVDELSSSDNLLDLADEVEEERILNTRMRTRQKSAFQKNLEKLKRRKLKLKDADDGSSNPDENETEEDNIPRRLFKGSKPSVAAENDGSDESASTCSSDFIVDDDTAVELPPEFSMETHQDLSHQFKKIFQFFVHIAVQPANERAAYMQKQIQDEQYFSVPLQVTRRNLSGLRDSLVSSSVWRPKFKNSLQRYPEFELTRLDFAVPSCDACHLGGRLSTLLGRLSGSFYNPCGFEPIPANNTEEAQGSKEFHLGRFCARRTRVFHEFSHWEYNLFQCILREINQLKSSPSSTGFHRVAYAGGRDPPEDLEDADGLCDWLDKRKIIDMEWQTMKSMMDSARHLELEKKNGIDE